jgi:PilZ domain
MHAQNLLRIDQRRYQRRSVHLPARLDPGNGQPPRLCTIVDISEMGARLALQEPQKAPTEFTLLLTPSGCPSRRCRLVWRGAEHVGVEFDQALPQHTHL